MINVYCYTLKYHEPFIYYRNNSGLVINITDINNPMPMQHNSIWNSDHNWIKNKYIDYGKVVIPIWSCERKNIIACAKLQFKDVFFQELLNHPNSNLFLFIKHDKTSVYSNIGMSLMEGHGIKPHEHLTKYCNSIIKNKVFM